MRSPFSRRLPGLASAPFILCLFLMRPLGADPLPNPSPVPTPGSGGARVLEIHKPLIPAAWGRVVQYHKETNLSPGGGQETLYEFVLQTENGIVRTATYHESADGTGYWEVYVWDEP